jgi:hypothetical protein
LYRGGKSHAKPKRGKLASDVVVLVEVMLCAFIFTLRSAKKHR